MIDVIQVQATKEKEQAKITPAPKPPSSPWSKAKSFATKGKVTSTSNTTSNAPQPVKKGIFSMFNKKTVNASSSNTTAIGKAIKAIPSASSSDSLESNHSIKSTKAADTSVATSIAVSSLATSIPPIQKQEPSEIVSNEVCQPQYEVPSTIAAEEKASKQQLKAADQNLLCAKEVETPSKKDIFASKSTVTSIINAYNAHAAAGHSTPKSPRMVLKQSVSPPKSIPLPETRAVESSILKEISEIQSVITNVTAIEEEVEVEAEQYKIVDR